MDSGKEREKLGREKRRIREKERGGKREKNEGENNRIRERFRERD